MDLLTQFIGAPSNALTLLAVIGILFFQLVEKGYLRIGKFHGKRNGAREENSGLRNDFQTLLSQMQILSAYFNHDTTKILASISEGIEKMNQKHEEWEKYGIPTRDCKTKQ